MPSAAAFFLAMPNAIYPSFADLRSLFVFAISHFVVDFVCAFLLFRLTALGAIPDDKIVWTYTLYNLLAFGLEIGIGVCFSERSARLASALGCVLLMSGVLLASCAARAISFSGVDVLAASPNVITNFALPSELARLYRLSFWATLCVGIGNAFFHVGGGIDSLARNTGGYWRSGVFIAPGSLGLAFGGLLGRELNSWATFELLSGAIAICGLLIWSCCGCRTASETDKSDVSFPAYLNWRFSARAFVLVASLFIIFTRSSVGFIAPELQTESSHPLPSAIMLAFGAFCGKFLGGILADVCGARAIGALSLFAAIPALCYSANAYFFLIGVVFLNMSTSITLVETSRSYGGKLGVAFGLTTLVLLVGYFTLSPIRGLLDGGALRTVRYICVATLALSGGFAYYIGRKKACYRRVSDG